MRSHQDSAVPPNSFEIEVEESEGRPRLDSFLAGVIEDASRSYLQRLIREGRVTINGRPSTRPSRLVSPGEHVAVELPPPPPCDLLAEPIPLDILHEDSDVIVVNKPPGLVVHPAPGHPQGTLVNALLHHCRDFRRAGEPERPGIVHRLDMFTSGVLVVAKSERAFASLAEQAREHRFDRRYVALVQGGFPEDTGRIVAPVGRSLADPKRMSVTGIRGRDAVTRFETIERFDVASLVRLELETGRTHQIRVHLRFAGHPVLGDSVYGVTDFSRWRVPETVKAALGSLEGQALHAERLGFLHPSGECLSFSAPPPPAFQACLDALRAWRASL